MSRARDIADSSATINLLDGVTAGTITNSKAAIYGASGEVNATTLQVAGSSITSSVAEINKLDGFSGDVGYRTVLPVGTKTSAYTLVVGDVGKYVQVGDSGSIVIPNATFAEGDVVSIFNNTSGSITITCSALTCYKAGENTNLTSASLDTRGVATVLFISGTVAVITGNLA
jgi:hypothetical protein